MNDDHSDQDDVATAATSAPTVAPSKPRPKRQPQYKVVVLNDDLHTYHYVIEALSRICGHSIEDAYRLALEIDETGLASVWTGTLEVAELKRDQIIGFGPDNYADQPVTFPLGCYVEPLA